MGKTKCAIACVTMHDSGHSNVADLCRKVWQIHVGASKRLTDSAKFDSSHDTPPLWHDSPYRLPGKTGPVSLPNRLLNRLSKDVTVSESMACGGVCLNEFESVTSHFEWAIANQTVGVRRFGKFTPHFPIVITGQWSEDESVPIGNGGSHGLTFL